MQKYVTKFQAEQGVEFIDIEKAKKYLQSRASEYLIVKHDKDGKYIHYHIVATLKSSRLVSEVANGLGIAENFIGFIKGKNGYENMLGYCFHLTKNAKEKFSYDETAVVDTNIDVKKIFENDANLKEKMLPNKEIENIIEQYGNLEISKNELMEKMDFSLYKRYATMIDKATKFRQLKTKQRNLKVYYITGTSGSGKTTLAKYFADIEHYSYFITGTGKDLLDGYDKEECIIVDDFRCDHMAFSELLKFTDNHTGCSIASRYANKDISNCKMIIITSVYNPRELYDSYHLNEIDSFEQFNRRIYYTYFVVNKNKNRVFRVDRDKSEIVLNMKIVWNHFHITSEEEEVDDIMNKISSKGVLNRNVDFDGCKCSKIDIAKFAI